MMLGIGGKEMRVKELIDEGKFDLINEGDDTNRKINLTFTCDLLSIAMSRMPFGAAWVTVMGNVNTLAVASLTDAACIILAEGCKLDELAVNKAKEQGITVLATDLPVFDAAFSIYQSLNDKTIL